MKNYKVIEKLLTDLTIKKRDNGEEFTICKEDSPLLETIRGFHDGLLPNDWLFNKTQDLLIRMHENWNAESIEDLRDTASEIADECTGIYNHELIEWSKTFYHYIDESIGEFGQEKDFIGLIRQGQCYQLDQMAHQLVDLINELAEEVD